MKKRIYISAICTSPPNSMGGNTKIILELINNLSDIFNFIIFTTQPRTFELNIKDTNKIKIIQVISSSKKMNFITFISKTDYVNNYFRDYFSKDKLNKNDYFISASDFAPDVAPIYNLKKKYEFKWVASLFLFIPNPLENLKKNYQFPFFKYLIYFFYQRYLFRKILKKSDLFLITNDIDKKYFPSKFHDYILAIYGGINSEQIINAKKISNSKLKYEAVFCSRLHPQKGINRLLDIWSSVVKKNPDAILAIIGNGDSKYEKFLKTKAKKLNINRNLIWFGYINNVAKYEIYLKSKIFLHSTIYDNNGMVAAEALCSGLPVIMYDLETFRDLYNEGCIKSREGDIKEFASLIIKMISNNEYYLEVKPDENAIRKFTKFWKWETRSKIFKDFIDKNLEG